MFGWFKKLFRQTPNNGHYTLLDCEELKQIQHNTRNAVIGAQREREVIRKAHLTIYAAEKRLKDHLNRIEESVKLGNGNGGHS